MGDVQTHGGSLTEPDWMTALRTEGEGAILLDLFVEPGSSRPGLGTYDQWRQRVHVRVSSQPTSGKANQELLDILVELLGVSSSDVTIVRGATTRRKTVRVCCGDVEAAIGALEEAFGTGG
jgi:uncharacterized protein (TIGR00251 family)